MFSSLKTNSREFEKTKKNPKMQECTFILLLAKIKLQGRFLE